MSNMYGKDKFHDRQKAVLQKSAQKIENDSGWSQDNFLRGYAEEILPASGAELSFGELCAIGEQVEQEAAFSAKEAMRNKIKARRDAERYKSTGTDSEQRTPNPFEDSSAIATESPKNEDTLNTMRKHADAQPTKSAGIKTSKKQSLVETTRETSVYKGYKQDKIEMRGDRAEMSDFPLYLNTVAGGLDRRDQTIGGFSFVVKIYAVPVVEIIG